MLNWFNRFFKWMWLANLLWLTLFILVICFLIGFIPPIYEPRIRLAGLFLQLCGVSTVLIGLEKLRIFFKLPSLYSIGQKWIQSRPPFRLPKRSITLNVELGKILLTGTGATLSLGASPDATIDDRVRILESRMQSVEKQASDLLQQITQVKKEKAEELLAERQNRERDVAALESKIETIETSGIYISVIGLVWLLIGLIMSTASVEISHLF
jgi:hypothetical protein